MPPFVSPRYEASRDRLVELTSVVIFHILVDSFEQRLCGSASFIAGLSHWSVCVTTWYALGKAQTTSELKRVAMVLTTLRQAMTVGVTMLTNRPCVSSRVSGRVTEYGATSLRIGGTASAGTLTTAELDLAQPGP